MKGSGKTYRRVGVWVYQRKSSKILRVLIQNRDKEVFSVCEDRNLKDLQDQLEKRRDEILERQDMRTEASRPVELDQAKVGRITRMDSMQQQAMAKATDQRATQELKQIEGALGRIQAGEYGYCIKCGEDISKGRLRVNPSVLTCIACAERAERG